jgi:predicted RNase H-like nuclease
MIGIMLAGVDGCHKGWIVAFGQSWPCHEPVRIEFCPDFKSVLEATQTCEVVAVDMPIGLPDGSELRECDFDARKALGPKRSSVFLTPPRSCIEAPGPVEFQSMHREIRGKGAGLPVWGIVPKIREVNRILEERIASEPTLQDRIIEFHPELTWQRLAGSCRLSSKRVAEGVLQRISLLELLSHAWLPSFPQKIPGNPAIDDVLDAVVGISAAQSFASRSEGLQRHPTGEPRRNSKGLRMEIWY